jgi:integrase
MPNKTLAPAARRRAEPPPLQARPRGFRFTDAFLQKLKMPEGQRELIQFEAGTGLGIRMSANGIFFIVQLPLPNGGRYRATLGAYGKLTVDDARKAVQALAGDIARGVDPRQKQAEAKAAAKAAAEAVEVQKFTARVLVERWRRDSLSTRRPAYALRAYRSVDRMFGSLLNVPAASLTRADVKKALEAKRTKKTKKTGRSRVEGGPGAVRNAVAALHAAYRWALSEELIDQNPLNGLKLPPRGADRDRVLSTDEARRIFAAAGAQPYPAGQFVKLLMLTGARCAEMAGLRWDEIITEEDGSKAIELPPSRTKNNSGHYVPLSQAALAVIAECAHHRVVGSSYVLTSDGWRSFNNYSRIKRALDETLAGAVPHWRYHDFRRTIVSTLAARPFRFSPIVLDKLLGHQPTKLTPIARIYQREEHLDDRREALEAWGRHLTAAPATVSKLPQKQREGRRSDLPGDIEKPPKRRLLTPS